METIKEIVKQDVKNAKADGYDGYLEDLTQHGCQSGMVTGLIYYSDTCKFFEDHKQEIKDLLKESCENTGLSISELFGDKWDKDDPFADEQLNQNLLAWFAYEETAYQLMGELENA